MTVKVIDVPGARRYEARMDGDSAVAGFAEYIRTTELIAFVHTEVAPEHEGKGVGSELVRTSSTRPAPRDCACWPPAPSTRAGSSATPSTPTCCTRPGARSGTDWPKTQ